MKRERHLRDVTIAPFKPDASFLLREFGFRRCYRRKTVFHGVSNLSCDCLRVELPVEARAKSSGRLATDFERMHRGGRVAHARETMEESSPGFIKAWDKQKPAENHALLPNEKPRRFSKTTPKTASKPRGAAGSDKAIRSRLTSARDSGLVGAVGKRGCK